MSSCSPTHPQCDKYIYKCPCNLFGFSSPEEFIENDKTYSNLCRSKTDSNLCRKKTDSNLCRFLYLNIRSLKAAHKSAHTC